MTCDSGCVGPECPPIGDPVPGDVAAIHVTKKTVLLTANGESFQLSAEAVNHAGDPVEASIEWFSNNESIVSIDAEGLLTAAAELGSAEIIAKSGQIMSDVINVVVAQPVADAILITDEMVEGEPTPVDENTEFGVGFRYVVRLSGTPAPEIGSILIGTGDQPVGGRVVAVTINGESIDVILEIESIDNLFQQIRFQQTIDLSQAPFEIPATLSDEYDVLTREDGVIVLTPKPATGKDSRRQMAVGTRALGSDCVQNGDLRFGLGSAPQIEFQPNLELELLLDGPVKRLALRGNPRVNISTSLTIQPGVGGRVTCKNVLKEVKIPVGGFLSLIFGGIVPIGWGADINGSVTATEPIGLQISGEATASAELGFECTEAGCVMLNSLTGDADMSFKPLIPGNTTEDEHFRFKLTSQVFAFADLKFGPPFLKKLQFEAFNLRAGPKMTFDLASVAAQIADTNYASFFRLSPLNAVAGAGSSVRKLQELFRISFTEFKIEGDLLSTIDSPTGQFTIMPPEVEAGNDQDAGEPTHFITALDKDTFLGVDVVEDVEYFWKRDGQLVDPRPSCNHASPTADPLAYNCETTFLEEHEREQTFYAFYKAKLLGVPLPVPLEISKDSKRTVLVKHAVDFSIEDAMHRVGVSAGGFMGEPSGTCGESIGPWPGTISGSCAIAPTPFSCSASATSTVTIQSSGLTWTAASSADINDFHGEGCGAGGSARIGFGLVTYRAIRYSIDEPAPGCTVDLRIGNLRYSVRTYETGEMLMNSSTLLRQGVLEPGSYSIEATFRAYPDNDFVGSASGTVQFRLGSE